LHKKPEMFNKARNILKLPINIIFFYRQAYNSANFTKKQQKKIFYSLVRLGIKQALNNPGATPVTQDIMGFKVTGYSYKSFALLFSEIFTGNEYFFVAKTASPVIIDCGGNIGMSVLYFKTLFPNSKIICFEPNPTSFAFLKKNVEQNNLTGVELVNKAIAGENGTTKFFAEEYSAGVISSLLESRGGETVVDVETLTLSSVIKKYSPDCIKMDIEGAELAVLPELIASGVLADVNQWMVEYHHKLSRNRGNLSSFLQPFEDAGFDYNLRASYKRKGKFQDMLIHFYRYGFYDNK